MNTKVAKKNNKGFTLIELIVVIAIIAVLAAILAPQYLRYVEKSRVTSDESTAKEIRNAIQTSCADSDVFEDVNSGDTVTWAKDGGKLTVSKGTKLSGELDKTVGTTPHMKSKLWRDHGDYVVTINVSKDDSTVSLSDNAPTAGGKAVKAES